MILHERNQNLCCLLLLVCAAGCSVPNKSATPTAVDPIGYPTGPWWRGDINETLLGVDHILIAHRDAPRTESGWTIPGQAPERSREEALALARRVHDELERAPQHFSELARKYSDDPTTAAVGGTLGEVFAPQLPASIVDALGNLRPGELSRVVESKLGFHIVRRTAVRPNEHIDGSQIVIGYTGSATWNGPDRVLTRTRAEAAALAAHVRDLLRADPSQFETLARTYSDSFDALQGGDYGQWSTYERGGEPTVLALLRALEPGQISDVLDTPRGFRILRHDANKQREEYAYTPIIVEYDTGGSMLPVRSVAEARKIARDIGTELKRHPEHFDNLRASHCDYGSCDQLGMTLNGGYYQFITLIPVLQKLRVGDVTTEPVPTPFGYAFARREDVASHPGPKAPEVNFELPRPAPLSLETASVAELRWYLGELRKAAVPQLNLSADKLARFDEILENLAVQYASVSPGERGRLTAEANDELAQALGPKAALQLGAVHIQLLRTLSGELLPRND